MVYHMSNTPESKAMHQIGLQLLKFTFKKAVRTVLKLT